MTDLETLKRANCSTAGVIIVSSGDDVVNLETAFKIHSLNPTAQIWVRLHRLEMAKLLELSKKPNFHFFCPYQQAADTLVNELHAQTREFP